jgi:hypothetical protein
VDGEKVTGWSFSAAYIKKAERNHVEQIPSSLWA